LPLSPVGLVGSFALTVALTGGTLLWATAQIAARAVSGAWLALPAASMLRVGYRVVAGPEDPAAAFGPEYASQLPGPTGFWTVFALLVGLLVAVSVRVLAWRSRRAAAAEPGSARWATKRDVRTLVVRRPEPGRLTLGHGPGGRLLAAEPGHSLLVLGPTQSGKTSGLAIPAILEWPGPVVATSVKNDLLAETLAARRERGTVWTYDPTGSVTGVPHAGWTPLVNCGTWSGALRTASWLTSAARDTRMQEAEFWYANAAKLLAPMLFAAATAGLTMTDVVRWIDLQEEDEVRLLLQAAGVEAAIAAAEASWGREQRTRSSVFTTAETILAAFADPAVATSAEQADIQPEQLLDGDAHSLYICAPLHEQDRLRPLFTALVQHVLVTAYEQAAVRGRLDPPLLLVLDEAANIAPLRDLAQVASTAAGLGIQLITVWQDRAQITARYGQHAGTVVNNHRAKLVLSGITDATTTGDIAQVIGDTEVVRHSTTVDAEGRTSATQATQTQMLASAAALRQLRPFEGVLVYGHLPPVALQLRRPARPPRTRRSEGATEPRGDVPDNRSTRPDARTRPRRQPLTKRSRR
jgi:type IV secretion system protein VirD4